MLRLAFFILLIAALALGAGWLADQPGYLLLEWGSWTLEAPLALGVLLVVALGLVLMLGWRLVRTIIGLPGWLGRRRAMKRRDKALNAFTQGMIAIASGEREAAAKWSARADKLFDEKALPRMLAAYAAEVAGDREAARRHYTSMIGDTETEFLGLRGLLQDAMRENDAARALEISERALKLRPGSVYAGRLHVDLLARSGNWDGAAHAVRMARKARALSDAEASHRLGLIALAEAKALHAEGKLGDALPRAEEANKRAPDLAPASALYADLLLALGKDRKAGKVLANAWRANPHPMLAEAFLRLHAAAKGSERMKAADAFVALRPEHAESGLLTAQCALAAGDFARARVALDNLPQPPGRRAANLLAALDDAQYGDRDGAERWREIARHSREDHGWQCHECHETPAGWTALCPACGAFGTLDWVRQKAAISTLSSPQGALPRPV